MKLILLSLFVSVSLIASRTSLFAGSETYTSKNLAPTSTPVEQFDWSGLYGGLNVGADFAQHEVQIDFRGPKNARLDNNGVTGGGQVGFNLQWNHLVAGLECDFQGASDNSVTRFQAAEIEIAEFPVFTFRREVDSHWLASVRGRVGFAWNRLLIYATGGAAFADLELESRDSFMLTLPPGPRVVFTSSRNETQVGWTVGAGAEWAFYDHLSLGIEYRHSDFGTESFPRTGVTRRLDFTADQAVAKINYRFWGFGRR